MLERAFLFLFVFKKSLKWMAERRGNKGEILTQFDQLLPSRVPTSKTEGVHNPDFLASERLAVYSKSSIFCIIIIRSIIGLTVKLDKKKRKGSH